MIRRPPRSTLFPLHDALPISCDLAEIVKEAFYIAGTGRPGPVLIEIPKDVANEKAPFIYPKRDRKSTRLNSSHLVISYAVFCLKKKKTTSYARTITHVANHNN